MRLTRDGANTTIAASQLPPFGGARHLPHPVLLPRGELRCRASAAEMEHHCRSSISAVRASPVSPTPRPSRCNQENSRLAGGRNGTIDAVTQKVQLLHARGAVAREQAETAPGPSAAGSPGRGPGPSNRRLRDDRSTLCGQGGASGGKGQCQLACLDRKYHQLLIARHLRLRTS
jgi:hypothetical protein